MCYMSSFSHIYYISSLRQSKYFHMKIFMLWVQLIKSVVNSRKEILCSVDFLQIPHVSACQTHQCFDNEVDSL